MTSPKQFDPIVSVALVPLVGTAPTAPARDAHTASVFVAAAEGPAEAIGRATAPTFRERMRRRYWHYEVELTHHPVALRFALPAREEAYAFAATVTLLWAVRDPVEVALLGVRDLKPILWTFLNQTLRTVSRQFGIEEIREAEADMGLVLGKQAGEIGFGLRLPMVAVSLRLDEDTERYLSQRVQSDRDGNLADDRQTLASREAAWRNRFDQEKAEWRRTLEQAEAEWRGRLQQAQARHEQALEAQQARHRLDLDATQADHARTVETLNAKHETELKNQRLDFYRRALDGGNHDVVVLQLIENPDDVGAVLRLIEAGGDKHYLRSREILADLIQNQFPNAADVHELTQHAIGQLRTALSASAPRFSEVVEEGVTQRVRTEEKHADRIVTKTTM